MSCKCPPPLRATPLPALPSLLPRLHADLSCPRSPSLSADPLPPHTLPKPCRYAYTSYRPYARRLREIQAAHQHERDANGTAPPASLPPTVPALEPDADDAFSVIMAWLYTRIPATR